MRQLLRRLFRRPPSPGLDGPEGAENRPGCESPDDFKWMFPPSTMVDPAPWDQYWQDRISHGTAGFVHIFVDDGELVDAMRANGLRTVLCIGNGISQEPRALAWAGFDVTSLDISPLSAKVAREAAPPEGFLAQLVGGRSGGLNGRLEFVVGDLCDPACCPGPYDVVIDRLTLQLYREAERPIAMQAVANRLGSPGIFFSQAHNGAWKPPEPRIHALESWFRAEGWPSWQGDNPLKGRVAWLFMTTG
ncbi:MAG TPA: class I SAM-dependent methyltransferase [Terriglobales bacterium]|nr:class I SAM-dependent methyltransferase [Terriglobales bacterium]